MIEKNSIPTKKNELKASINKLQKLFQIDKSVLAGCDNYYSSIFLMFLYQIKNI